MRGKIIIEEQIDPKENRFNNDIFDRSMWLMEDLISENYIDFCHRYLQMPSFEEMYDLINLYFHSIKNPMRGLQFTDPIKGNRYLYHTIDNTQKKQMYHLIDNTIKRNMIIIQERMAKYEREDTND